MMAVASMKCWTDDRDYWPSSSPSPRFSTTDSRPTSLLLSGRVFKWLRCSSTISSTLRWLSCSSWVVMKLELLVDHNFLAYGVWAYKPRIDSLVVCTECAVSNVLSEAASSASSCAVGSMSSSNFSNCLAHASLWVERICMLFVCSSILGSELDLRRGRY